MQDNRWAAWEIPSLGGYHGAKMRAYQDMMDNVFFSGPDRRLPLNLQFFSAMNCKYLLTEGQLPPVSSLEMVDQDPSAKLVLYRNTKALERAYFTDSILVMTDRASVIRKIADPAFLFDYMAVVDKPLPGPVEHDALRTVAVTEYTPHRVKLQVHTSKPSFVVLSDAYYKPGWEALDNGIVTPIYQVNGFVRGIYVKPGDHVIQFDYVGKAERLGENVATLSHFLVLGLVIGAYLYERRKTKRAAA